MRAAGFTMYTVAEVVGHAKGGFGAVHDEPVRGTGAPERQGGGHRGDTAAPSGQRPMSHEIPNAAAVEVGQLAERMIKQYFAHHAAIQIARDIRSDQLIPQVEAGQIVPVFRIVGNDGSAMTAHFPLFLQASRDPEVQTDFDKVWLVGALLTVGNALGAHQYFGHMPEAEIIRHLRNGVAHGNKFSFEHRVKDAMTGRLKHPANTARYPTQAIVRDVETNLDGTEVLFAWGGPLVVVDCLRVLGVHLSNVGHGLPCP
jgi:hypothetical protein